MRYRLRVEIAWLETLASQAEIQEVSPLSQEARDFLALLVTNFDVAEAQIVKNIEAKTAHDVKAIEYYLKEKCDAMPELKKIKEFIHFGCTSEDINNVAYALMIKESREQLFIPEANHLITLLKKKAKAYADNAMLARTHGQPATPTTMGKELANFVSRLKKQLHHIEKTEIFAKFNGAVGNFNAHVLSYPEVNWLLVTQHFISELGLHYNAYTTQIENHDYLAEILLAFSRFNTVLIDLSRDTWGYISLAYFKQETAAHEIGSSTMPHKINPIDFENAEGNLAIANTLCYHFAEKLPISRFQRDLVDSTTLRNIGVALSHTLIAWQGMAKGFSKLSLNLIQLEADLSAHPEILAEGIQTVMRRYGLEAPYEQLKQLTRGQGVSLEDLRDFIAKQSLPEEIKSKLLKMTASDYSGIASFLAKHC